MPDRIKERRSPRAGDHEFHHGYSLPARYYLDPDIFGLDLDMLARSQWLLVGHTSQLKDPGDFIVFRFGSYNLLITRGKDGSIRAMHNVCRHRGSIVCDKPAGNQRSFTCPYHAWTYEADGALRQPRGMPDDFDASKNGLIRVHCNSFEGMVFINLAPEPATDFQTFVEPFKKFLKPYKIASTKIAAHKSYETRANWKLVTENFLECYHCQPAHKTYSRVHDMVKHLALGSGINVQDSHSMELFRPVLREWEAKVQKMNLPTGFWCADQESPYFSSASRLPIGGDAKTETADGQPAAPLLGDLPSYDGGQSACFLNPVSAILCNSDYALMVFYRLISPKETIVEVMWLVNENANVDLDFCMDRLTEFWHVTLTEDKKITEDNQLGIESPVYQPGRYSIQEGRLAELGVHYLTAIEAR